MADSVIDRILGRVPNTPKDAIHSIIFGFGHRSRCGKDTVAQMIREGRGYSASSQRFDKPEPYDIRIYSFAQELKREVNKCAENSGGMSALFNDGLRVEGAGYWQENANILALPEWVQYDPQAPMDDPDCPYGKQRTLLQWWGTEYRRSINPDYWVKRVAKRIAEERPEIALITDVRFPNEAAFCQRYGNAVKVERPSLPPLKGMAGAHASELALLNFQDWDTTIMNSGTLAELRDNALLAFDSLMSAVPETRPASM
jgi:hypothetical protein